jgi:hypothetical protein
MNYSTHTSVRLVIGFSLLAAFLMLAPFPAAAQTPIQKKIAVILLNFQDDTTQPRTVESTRAAIFTNTNSVNAFYKENSFDTWSLIGRDNVIGDVFGWYTVPYTKSDCSSTAMANWRASANAQAKAAGHDLSSGYDVIAYVFPDSVACSFGGQASSIGGRPAWVMGRAYDDNNFVKLIGHEFGHSFNLMHANALRCNSSSGVLSSIGPYCVSYAYFDLYDIMGFYPNPLRHLNVYHKAQTGSTGTNFIPPAKIQTVTSSGTYTIEPVEKVSQGIQALAIPKTYSYKLSGYTGTTTINGYYYVEFRQPYGRLDYFPTTDPAVNGVMIYLGGNYNGTAQYSQAIDTTPGSGAFSSYYSADLKDAALGIGKTFQDPYANISITVKSVAATGATVDVSLGSVQCIKANPTLTLAPTVQYASAGETKTYTYSIKNNDTSTCPASQFTLTPSSLPSGFVQTPASAGYNLMPGAAATGSFLVTSGATTQPATYSVTENVINSSNTTYQTSSNTSFVVSVPSSTDTMAPLVSITSPTNGATVSGVVNVTFSGSDNSGTISKYEFYENGTYRGYSLVDTLLHTWDTKFNMNGSNSYVIKAYDPSGNIGTATVTVNVNNTPDSSPPTAPTNLSTSVISPSQINLVWSASTDNVGVTGYGVYQNNSATPILRASTNYASIGLTAGTLYSYYVVAYDAAGNTSVQSATVSATTQSGTVSDTTSPSVSISSPTGGSVSGTVTVTVSASDASGISKVELYKNSVLMGTDTTSPYTFSWNTAAEAAGSSIPLYAKAYDPSNNQGTSPTVTVTVNNAPDTESPTVQISQPLNGSTVPKGSLKIRADAYDLIGVTEIQVYLNNGLIGTCLNVTSCPASASVKSLPIGTSTITAYAKDAAGNAAVPATATVVK